MISTYRVTLRSISNFNSLRLIFVDYFILPIVSLTMFLLIVYNSNQNYTRTLLGTVITSGIASGIGVTCASFIYDQDIGISDDIASIRPAFSKYWLPKFIIAAITLTVEILTLGGIGLITLNEAKLFPKLLLSLPLAILISSTLGYVSAITGFRHENPYWLANIITGSLVLLSGVIISITQYPFWLRIFAELLPISNLLDWILNTTIYNYDLLIVSGKIFIWFLLCLLIKVGANYKLRK